MIMKRNEVITMSTFNIGDRVRVKKYAETKEGVVVDKLYSEAHDKFIYRLHLEGCDKPSAAQYDADSLELVANEPVTYHHEFEYLDNIVIAIFYEIRGDKKIEVGRGHGHIIHEGAFGVAQASSYALRRIWQKMEGETND